MAYCAWFGSQPVASGRHQIVLAIVFEHSRSFAGRIDEVAGVIGSGDFFCRQSGSVHAACAILRQSGVGVIEAGDIHRRVQYPRSKSHTPFRPRPGTGSYHATAPPVPSDP